MSKSKITKKDIKIYIIFAALMVFCLLAGYALGSFGKHIQSSIDSIDWAEVAGSLYMPAAFAFIVLVVGIYAFSFMTFISAGKKYAELEKLDDEAFEDGINKVELLLSKAITKAEFVLILSFFCFPLIGLCSETMEKAGMQVSPVGDYISVLTFSVSLALYITVTALVVSLEKKINPEKKGNVFDIHFQKKWMGSMDEAELMKTARAAQKAFAAGILTCMLLWILALITMFVFNTGIMPILCITVIMLVMVITSEINAR